MRWQTVVAALALGMLGGAGWVMWDERQETHAAAVATPAPPPNGSIRLAVHQDAGALRLRWSPKAAGVRDADHGTLTVTDGDHVSKLELDGKQLQSGLVSWWPQGSRVGFRLQTDSGASGSIETANLSIPEKPKVEVAKAVDAAPKRKPPAASRRPRTIDDGLEWTQRPPRDSKWSRLKHKLPFWHKSTGPSAP